MNWWPDLVFFGWYGFGVGEEYYVYVLLGNKTCW